MRETRLDLERRLASHELSWLTTGLAAAVICLVYLFTMAPTVFTLDSAEFTVAAFSLGLVHAPGYPVYLLVGHLFTLLPFGDVGYRLNLLSALASVGTATLLMLLVQRLTQRILPGIVAGLSYAFCFYVWSLSVIAEVYAFQSLLLACILVSLLQWRYSGRPRWLLLSSFLSGLALANNPSTLLWWPGLLFLIWTTPHRQKLTATVCLYVIGIFCLALTPVLYLPLRSAAQPEFVQVGHFDSLGVFHPVDLTQLRNLVWYVSGRQFAHWILAYTPGEYADQALQFLVSLWAAFFGIGLPLGLGGAWSLWQRNRVVGSALVLTVLPHALFFIGYRAVDKETMFLPVFLVWAILIGIGLARLVYRLPRQVHLFALLLPASLFWVNLPYADVSDFRIPEQRAAERLREADANALYLAQWGDAELMRYHQITANLRTDVQVVNPFFVASSDLVTLVEGQLAGKRSVYSSYEVRLLAGKFMFRKIGNGYHIQSRGNTP